MSASLYRCDVSGILSKLHGADLRRSRYGIEAFYHNTSDHDIDAMAQIDLYFYSGDGVVLSLGP